MAANMLRLSPWWRPLTGSRNLAPLASLYRGGSTRACTSFIDRVKVGGANALIGAFTTAGKFDSCLSGLEVTQVEPGQVRAKFVVGDNVSNFYGTLHGGAISTLVDVVGTMAILSKEPTKPGVSVDCR